MGLTGNIIGLINLFFAIVIGLYFWNLLRAQQGTKVAVDREAKKEMEKLQRLRSISLTNRSPRRPDRLSLKRLLVRRMGSKRCEQRFAGRIPSIFCYMDRREWGKRRPPGLSWQRR